MNKFTRLIALPARNSAAAARLAKLSICMLGFISLYTPAYCQENEPVKSSWWIGLAGGANFNRYTGYTSALNVDINASPAFSKGNGVGGYFAGLIEFHPEGWMWGLRMQMGADSRRATFNAGGNRLKAKIGYFSLEPALMVRPFKSFFIYAGPQAGLLWSTGFTYKEPNAPEYPQKNINYPAYIKNLKKITVSLHAGIQYDFMIREGRDKQPMFVIAPFITYLPALDREIRTIEELKLNTLRAGIIIKVNPAE